jgi:hypothetical protein
MSPTRVPGVSTPGYHQQPPLGLTSLHAITHRKREFSVTWLNNASVSYTGASGTNAFTSTISAADSFQFAAVAFARTCSGVVAPAMTEVTHGYATSQDIASSSSV